MRKRLVGVLVAVVLSFGTPAVAGRSKGATELAGDVLQLALPAAAFAATEIADDPEGRGQFLKGAATNLGATYAIKFLVDRPRPAGNGRYSFPSGHTSVAFQGASFLQRRYGWRYGLPAYAVASFVGWSRVDCNMHYVSDAVAGAALGVASTYLFTTPREDLQVSLFGGTSGVGIGLMGRW